MDEVLERIGLVLMVRIIVAILFMPYHDTGDCTIAFEELKPDGIVKVAICQIVCLDGDREGNLVRINNALAGAKLQDAQVACFPETALYGW